MTKREKLNFLNPVFLKISPDEDPNTHREIIRSLIDFNLDGLIATNTTIHRNSSHNSLIRETDGGLSGELLYEKSNEVLKDIANNISHNLLIIGVGGVNSKDSFNHKLNLGASLVQIYTGFIFQGPKLIKEILR